MKIFSINNSIKNVAFGLNRNKNNLKKGQQEAGTSTIPISTLTYPKPYLPTAEEIQQIKKANQKNNSKDPFLIYLKKSKTKSQLDMAKINAITLPKQDEIRQLRSFENSNKKFAIDKYQKDAIENFNSGKTTIVTAPTGIGKTLIAEYGIEDVLKKGKKIIYLSPLKALSNEKFTKFSEEFGNYDENGVFLNSDNVGIVTGDTVINPDAQLICMTTEIYRNMVNMEDEETTAEVFRDFAAVIYDEFHYLGDPDRGAVWEEAVMSTPKHMQQLMLSATASNAKQISEWIQNINPQIETHLTEVQDNERYVPLNEYVFGYKENAGFALKQIYNRKIDIDRIKYLLSERQKQVVDELEELYDGEDFVSILKRQQKNSFNEVNAENFCDVLVREKGISKDKARQIAYILSDNKLNVSNDIKLSYCKNLQITPLLKILEEKNMTPALFFVFSKKRCKKELEETSKKLGTLLTPEQSKQVLDEINEAKEKGIYLGDNFDEEYMPKLLMGYAVHHAGMLPPYKSLIEKLSRKGLIKACFATETLLAGIDMPFKTTVFTSLEKFNGRRQVEITPTIYKQGSGRAGRRGMYDLGNVVICPNSAQEFKTFKKIMNSDDTKIKSTLSLSYASLLQNSKLNNLNDYLQKSFYTFQNGNAQKIKKDAKNKINYLKERGFITFKHGNLIPTQKGEMAKNVYGINQILFCELMSDPKYTKDLTPEELAALIAIFADINDEKARKNFKDDMSETAQKLSPAIELAEQISREQIRHGIDDEIKMSTNLASAILKFAHMPYINDKDCTEFWRVIFEDLKKQYVIMHEGDLLRVFNSTIDLLKTIVDVSDDPELTQKADEAIRCLKKPPVTDILKYELNIK